MAFDEIKTDLLDRREALRSKTVDGIHQEIWANFLTYNLIRQEMAETARAHGEPVDRMGFVASLSAICDFFIYQSSDPAHGRLPERLRDLRGKIWLFRNPERRCRRTNPREVKCLYGPYDRKPSRGPEMASNA